MYVSRSLLSCPRCDSALIQIEFVRRTNRGTLLDRHCPECDLQDVLSVAGSLADLLLEHALELARSLEELADCLEAADELWVSDMA